MESRLLVVALAFVAVSFAGCADGSAAADPKIAVPESAQQVDITKETGGIRGVVIDETIKPLADVRIVLTSVSQETVTAVDGGFTFGKLEPGDYFVSASKLGFQSIQTSTAVVAGVAEPPLLRIILPRMANLTAAYANTQLWQGFSQCAVAAVIVAGQICGPLDGRYISYFSLDSIPDYMQAEMIWKSTQPTTPKLQLGFYKSGTTDWKYQAGISPILVNATGAQLVAARGNTTTQNPMRVFPPFYQCPGGITNNPTGCDPQTFVIVNVNQAWDVYLTQFYGFLPAEGWLFRVDGACTTPEQCGA